MDISSLQASPIGQAEESFVTLEESWRAPIFKGETAQSETGDQATASAFGRFSPSLQSAAANGAPAEIVHFTENVFTGWKEFDIQAGSDIVHLEPTPTFVDEFAATETPRTNNQSFTSEDSSYKESFQSRRAPPTIPNRFSRTSKAKQSGAPDLTSSSNDTSGQSDESPERPGPYDNRSDVTRIIAALERVIPPTHDVMTNSSILYEGTDTDTSGAAEHTRSSLGTDLGDTRYSTESSSFPTDTFNSSATNDRSTAVYDDDDDIFDGLEMEPDHAEEGKRSTINAETDFRRANTPVMRPAFAVAPSQTSSATDITSNRLYGKVLRSSMATVHDKALPRARPKSRQAAHSKKHSKNGYTSFRTSPPTDGAPVDADKLFKHIYADEYSSSDDSSYSSDTYTVLTPETLRTTPTKENTLLKSFLDFLTFGDDESVNTMESESLVSSAIGQRFGSAKKPTKKPMYSAPPAEPDVASRASSFPSIGFGDLFKFVDCDVGNDDLLRTTEQHLSDEFGISERLEEYEPAETHDPEVETLVYDAAFFDDLWNELASRQPSQPLWNFNLCGSIDDTDSVSSGTETLSPEEQKIFNAVFPPTSASKTARRKAAQVLSVCRQRFPSMYQSLVTQLDRKARLRKTSRGSTPTQRVSTPVNVLPSVMEEGTDTEGDDFAAAKQNLSAGFAYSQAMLSSLQETASTFLSAPSSTFVSEVSEAAVQDSLMVRGDAVIVAESMVVENDAVVMNELPSESPAEKQSAPTNEEHAEKAFAGEYLDAGAEERLVLNYASTDKECKESDECVMSFGMEQEDESTYIFHYIDESSEAVFVAEVSRDESSDVDLLAHLNNDPLFDLTELSDESGVTESKPPHTWESFTPPRRQSADRLNRSASVPPLRSNETWEHFTPERLDLRFAVGSTERLAEKGAIDGGSDPVDTFPTAFRSVSAPKTRIEGSGSDIRLPASSTEPSEETATPTSHPVTPKVERGLYGTSDPKQSQWEAFSAPYFEAAKEQELVATVKRDNTKKVNAPKLQPSKLDKGRPHSRSSKRLDQPTDPSPPLQHLEKKLPKQSKSAGSPTSVAPPKIRKLRVADLYPPSRLDFEEFDKKGSRKASVKSLIKQR